MILAGAPGAPTQGIRPVTDSRHAWRLDAERRVAGGVHAAGGVGAVIFLALSADFADGGVLAASNATLEGLTQGAEPDTAGNYFGAAVATISSIAAYLRSPVAGPTSPDAAERGELAVQDFPSIAVGSPGWSMGQGAVWLFQVDTMNLQALAGQTFSMGSGARPAVAMPMPAALRWRRLDSTTSPIMPLFTARQSQGIGGGVASSGGLMLGTGLASGVDLDNNGAGDLLLGASGYDEGKGCVLILANPFAQGAGLSGAGSSGGT